MSKKSSRTDNSGVKGRCTASTVSLRSLSNQSIDAPIWNDIGMIVNDNPHCPSWFIQMLVQPCPCPSWVQGPSCPSWGCCKCSAVRGGDFFFCQDHRYVEIYDICYPQKMLDSSKIAIFTDFAVGHFLSLPTKWLDIRRVKLGHMFQTWVVRSLSACS